MNGSWQLAFAVLGLALPGIAALWEFVLVGRKRLGYRVQMDTTARDERALPYAGVLQRMQRTNGGPLRDPSFVLMRIENSGWAPIVENSYLAPDRGHAGIQIKCRGRRVVGMVVTELSRNELRGFFTPGSDDQHPTPHVPGLGVTDGVIELPKVKLNRGDHYKVLAVLEREESFADEEFPEPEVVASIVGGVRRGKIKKTEYYPFASKPVRWVLALLVMVSAVQSILTFTRHDVTAAPLDCATGTLTLSGSTAFAPVLQEAAKQYHETCPDSFIPITDDTFHGSVSGLDALAAAGRSTKPTGSQGLGERLAFSDGPKSDGRPQLLPRPVALSLFALVVNKDAGVQDLSLNQIRNIYAQLHGFPLPHRTAPSHWLTGKPLPPTTRNTLENPATTLGLRHDQAAKTLRPPDS